MGELEGGVDLVTCGEARGGDPGRVRAMMLCRMWLEPATATDLRGVANTMVMTQACWLDTATTSPVM